MADSVQSWSSCVSSDSAEDAGQCFCDKVPQADRAGQKSDFFNAIVSSHTDWLTDLNVKIDECSTAPTGLPPPQPSTTMVKDDDVTATKKPKKNSFTISSYGHSTLGLKERPDAGMSTEGTGFPSGWELSVSNTILTQPDEAKNPDARLYGRLGLRFALGQYNYRTGVAFPGAPTYLKETRLLSVGPELGVAVRLPLAFKIALNGGVDFFGNYLTSNALSTKQVCLDASCSETVTQETGGVPATATDFVEYHGLAPGIDTYLQVKLQWNGIFGSFRFGFQKISFPNPELPVDSILYNGAFYGFGGGFNF